MPPYQEALHLDVEFIHPARYRRRRSQPWRRPARGTALVSRARAREHLARELLEQPTHADMKRIFNKFRESELLSQLT